MTRLFFILILSITSLIAIKIEVVKKEVDNTNKEFYFKDGRKIINPIKLKQLKIIKNRIIDIDDINITKPIKNKILQPYKMKVIEAQLF